MLLSGSGEEMAFTSNYSAWDKLFYYVSSALGGAQLALSDLEDFIYKEKISRFSSESPVFISGLPRAGTTLLLEVLESSGDFFSHSYRDMPLVVTPLFWSKISARFHADVEAQPRAHDDGMMVDIDSPEALEEMLWVPFWKQQYSKKGILPWDPRFSHEEFESFFKCHIKKLAYREWLASAKIKRYLSKNNLNISRVGYLAKAFPNARIVIPFRSPLDHASSLLRQHNNFTEMHGRDSFSRRYMRQLGHFDFGHNFSPVRFYDWNNNDDLPSEFSISFWLLYWINTYRYLINSQPRQAGFFSYDGFCSGPEKSIDSLSGFIDSPFDVMPDDLVGRITTKKSYQVNEDNVDETLLVEASNLHSELLELAINR